MTDDELRALIDKHPPMTEEERREQAISFAYGNTALSNPDVTREMVERAYDDTRRRFTCRACNRTFPLPSRARECWEQHVQKMQRTCVGYTQVILDGTRTAEGLERDGRPADAALIMRRVSVLANTWATLLLAPTYPQRPIGTGEGGGR
jgi:hypothetical protein